MPTPSAGTPTTSTNGWQSAPRRDPPATSPWRDRSCAAEAAATYRDRWTPRTQRPTRPSKPSSDIRLNSPQPDKLKARRIRCRDTIAAVTRGNLAISTLWPALRHHHDDHRPPRLLRLRSLEPCERAILSVLQEQRSGACGEQASSRSPSDSVPTPSAEAAVAHRRQPRRAPPLLWRCAGSSTPCERGSCRCCACGHAVPPKPRSRTAPASTPQPLLWRCAGSSMPGSSCPARRPRRCGAQRIVFWRLAGASATAALMADVPRPDPAQRRGPQGPVPGEFWHHFCSGSDPAELRLPRDTTLVGCRLIESFDSEARSWVLSTLHRRATRRLPQPLSRPQLRSP